MSIFAFGIDYWTESGRALVVDTATGRVVGSVAIVTLEFSSFESVIMRGHLNN